MAGASPIQELPGQPDEHALPEGHVPHRPGQPGDEARVPQREVQGAQAAGRGVLVAIPGEGPVLQRDRVVVHGRAPVGPGREAGDHQPVSEVHPLAALRVPRGGRGKRAVEAALQRIDHPRAERLLQRVRPLERALQAGHEREHLLDAWVAPHLRAVQQAVQPTAERA
eukprot:6060389-Pyramimonas_sp.AAC.1